MSKTPESFTEWLSADTFLGAPQQLTKSIYNRRSTV